jgi:hypothetical protein
LFQLILKSKIGPHDLLEKEADLKAQVQVLETKLKKEK